MTEEKAYPMKRGEIATKSMTDVIQKGTGTVYTTIGSTTLNHDGKTDVGHVEEMFNVTIPTDQQAAYTTVKVANDKLVVTTKQLNGLVLDEFTIEGDDSYILGFTLYHQLTKHNVKCVILAPTTMSKPAGKKKVKTDKRDAALIARCLAPMWST